METTHDFAEDDAERFRRRLIVASKPAATRPGISASDVSQVEFGFGWPCEAGEIAEADALAVDATDISVRPVGLFSFWYFCGNGIPQFLSADPG